MRRLALGALLQDRLAEDSPAAADGVKLLDVLSQVAAAAKAVRVVLLHVPPPCVCAFCFSSDPPCAGKQAARRAGLGLPADATEAECVARETEVRLLWVCGGCAGRGEGS